MPVVYHVITLQTHPCNENRVFPVYAFFTGKNLFSLQVFPCKESVRRENPVFITGMHCCVFISRILY
jgi:hypothetical protein